MQEAQFTSSSVVQRQPDDVADEAPLEEEIEELNLDQLAEDVFPLVKRILEIESERLSLNRY